LHLPIIMTERASTGAQLSRLKQFEAVREFFTGPLAGVFLELPFVLIFVGVIAGIAGPLAWVPVVLIGLFALVALIAVPAIRRGVAESGEARAVRQSYLIEMFTNFRSIKCQASEGTWSERHRELSARAATTSFRSSQTSIVVQTLAQFLMMGAGIATIALGTLSVMEEQMTVGALVACMALVWRVLSPLQMAFLSFTRLEQVLLGLRQLNQLMRLQLERDPAGRACRHRALGGEITFSRVSLRYTPNGEPALLGVGLQIEPGEIVAIAGANGSGKSSILKLIAGLYQAQAGALLIDGIDIRQLDMAELRGAVAYVPQTCTLFHGTIAQNLRLANPTASDADLTRAAVDAGLMEEILTLPDGFDTRITDQVQRQLPKGFKQKLMLARAYVKDVPIYLLDEPANNLDWEGDQALMRKLQQLRGRATVFVVTHRPSHMRIADRVVCMDAGQVMVSGTPDEVLPKIGMA
ncbi:MAG: ATP-binding cassette domain-containing protein, partial [bacterium]|nr:ATP-binding cassette domain-containing protein [bacterium]